ncbi:hypothetical protein BU26DRAFT_294120 [Trematosphaeria pertusa]|uniref:Uncharacterized protein n=1 Tax=Trematosphaeria pertusa TaxID=390896 RepID=A0A6A6IHC1_9PLEO|nr:uncharacterized protein BU26DRAFT_294120 [Trematosphaeria pertusa]KAF2250005.1 hypothetical protein BU26DRAFT_294120 [Trematosphaeria pertusa]
MQKHGVDVLIVPSEATRLAAITGMIATSSLIITVGLTSAPGRLPYSNRTRGIG